MSGHHESPEAIGGRLLAPPVPALLFVFALAAAVIGYRFVAGVGPVSNMSDGYAWGIWEPINVVVFTGIGAGAYSLGLLCYVLNQGKYHPLIRPAVLLGAVCYSLGGSSIMIASGRYWNAYWFAVPGVWHFTSVLLEVALCVLTYVSVLWIEVMPSVLDGAAQSRQTRWQRVGRTWGPRLQKAMPFIIALAMLLPTMHQSSLGGLMLVAGPKMHPLWHTWALPLLALISCLSMGFGAVVVLTTILKYAWNAKADRALFVGMSKVNGGLLLAYAAIRVVDVVAQGKLQYLRADVHGFFFLLELALFVIPGVLFFTRKVQANTGRLFGMALLAVLAGALWRNDAFLLAYNPGPGWQYFPSIGETVVTVGMACVGAVVFIVMSRLFPVVILEKAHEAAPARAGLRGAGIRTAAS